MMNSIYTDIAAVHGTDPVIVERAAERARQDGIAIQTYANPVAAAAFLATSGYIAKAHTVHAEDLRWEDIGEGWKRAEVVLKQGMSAWNPASTKHLVPGPGVMLYHKSPSGAVTAHWDPQGEES